MIRRATMVVGLLALASAGFAGCDPKTALSPVSMPAGADSGRLVAINNAGLAVGIVDGDHPDMAFTYNVGSGASRDISTISAGGDFPTGGTFHGVSNVNSHGVVLGAASEVGNWDVETGALYDSAKGTYTAIPCGGHFALGWMGLSDDGLVACGTSLYDTIDGQSIAVPQPTGCNGTLSQVNDQVALGYCTSGTEPFFVTDLSTEATTAFGAAQGFFDPYYDNLNMGRLTNGNLFLATSEGSDGYTSVVFDVSAAAPRVVPINGGGSFPGLIIGASDSGLLSIGLPAASASDHGIVLVYDTRTESTLDTFTGSLGGMPVPYGVNDSGQVVGVNGDGQPFVVVIPPA